MKQAMLGLIFGMVLLGYNSGAQATDSSTEWVCTASGNTETNQESQSVIGDYAPTEKQAQNSAMSQCYFSGLMMCTIEACFPPQGTSDLN